MLAQKTSTNLIEKHSIDYVPPSERYGKVRDQFTVWSAANASALNLFFGSLAIILGLSFPWAIVAIAVGTVIGGILTALHALQGPRLGVPQLLQSRAQFGYYGATLFFVTFIVVSFGFMASQLVIQAYSMHQVFPLIGIPSWIIAATVPTVLIAILGYRWVHIWQRWATIVLALTALVMFFQAFTSGGHLSASERNLSPPSASMLLAVTVLFIINIAGWAPTVSDYSRYLPERVRFAPAFWAVFLGNVLSTVAFAVLGAYITALLPGHSLYGAVQTISGDWALIIMAISLTGANVFNTYSGMLALISLADTIRKVPRTIGPRIIGILVMALAALAAAVLGYRSFLTNFVDFLNVLVFVFFPWSAVNLADFYIVRHGHYRIEDFFEPDGPYGKFHTPAVIAYLLGLAAEIGFVSQTFYTGPFVKAIDGIDVSWIVGFVVPFFVYVLLMRRSMNPRSTRELQSG